MNLGEIIKAYRDSHNLSQREFAKKCGISYTYISALERNRDYRSGKNISPTIDMVNKIAIGLNTSSDEIWELLDNKNVNSFKKTIKVYSSVHAGILNEMIKNVVDTEDLSEEMLKSDKEYFGLKVKGDSMYPEYLENDTIIVERCNDCESGDDCVVSINGNEAFLKRVYKNTNGITLQALNPKYEPLIYTNDDIINIPITILGIVRELRRRK